jgi:hypothetical protein
LEKLQLFADHITSDGWVLCFRQLIDSRSALVDIGFGFDIDDEGVEALSTLVAGHMNTISSLCLAGNYSISADGWSTVANVLLPSSTSKLKTLRVGSSNQDEVTGSYPITNDVIIDLVTALAGNSTLELLELDYVDDDVDSAMEALLTVLCDLTSVDSVCRSNHTLHECVCSNSNIFHTRELDSLLELNEDTDKVQVVRTKLLIYFYSDVDNFGPVFGRMETTILPNAMEWIGRDRLGYSAMFEFCRSVPALFK